MKTVLALVLLTLAGVAHAADSPAQAAYCVTMLRHEVEELNAATPPPILPLPPDATPEMKAADAKLKTSVAKLEALYAETRRLLVAWRALALNWAFDPRDYMSEELRGEAQAKADIAVIAAPTAADLAWLAKCNATSDPAACLIEQEEKVLKSDPTIIALRGRLAVCTRGPSL